ncbi:hypothetical protein [Klebsiella aerogenes]|uniref:hypothetical protein n=1 Tax=Klebsiella aerogenes TaxID=548 RepID=UPI000C78D043|nr:hypothetical protein [Klebsiella aerogenes]
MDTVLLLLGFFWVLSLIASYKLGSRNADKKLIEYQRETFNVHAANLNKAMSLSREVVSSCREMESTVKSFDLWDVNQSLEAVLEELRGNGFVSKKFDTIIGNQHEIYEKVERIPWIKDDINDAKDEILSGISASKHRTTMARLKSRNIDTE